MPRNRTMRLAALGSTVQRAAAPAYTSPRSRNALRRRVVAGVLIALSLVLITGYFREDETGALHDVQGVVASVLHPFQVGAERVARPFQDVYGWVASFVHAKSENERLKDRLAQIEQELIQNSGAARENRELRAMLEYRSGRTFPGDYEPIGAAVTSHRLNEFQERIVVATGRNDGVRVDDPVLDSAGHLVGHVSKTSPVSAQVTLLTDGEFAASAYDQGTGTYGLVSHGQGAGESLILDLVPKDKLVDELDLIVTAGRRAGGLPSLYPKGIVIGTVTKVGISDIDIYQSIQVEPLADFSSLSSVVVLVPKTRARVLGDVLKAGLVFFAAVVLQTALVSAVEPFGGTADLVLVTLTAIALLRGAIFGALAGFYAGFLLDAAYLETLGLSSLLLTLSGYWIGRYGETTGRDRAHAPVLAIGVVTVLYALGELGMHYLVGDAVSARDGLVDALPAAILLNLALTIPVYALVRRIFARPGARAAIEVEFGTH